MSANRLALNKKEGSKCENYPFLNLGTSKAQRNIGIGRRKGDVARLLKEFSP